MKRLSPAQDRVVINLLESGCVKDREYQITTSLFVSPHDLRLLRTMAGLIRLGLVIKTAEHDYTLNLEKAKEYGYENAG